MLKILVRILMILAVTGLVAGAIYLFATNGGLNLIGGNTALAGFSEGGRGVHGQPPAFMANPGSSQGMQRGQPPAGGGFGRGREGGEGQMDFSLAGLSGVAVQLGKVAVITAIVVLVQALVRRIQRRRQAARSMAA